MDIKKEYSDCILFFRLGDFYEMFFEDAKIASKVLEIALTGKSCGLEERAPMCGIPFHSAENYIARLVERGYKVAIGEQVEDPSIAKGIVKREVVRIVSPGTVVEENMLDSKKNNYLVCAYLEEENVSIAYSDISTGELFCFSFEKNKFFDEISKINPKEIIISNNLGNDSFRKFFESRQIFVNVLEDINFDDKSLVLDHFGINYLTENSLINSNLLKPICGLFKYLIKNQKQLAINIGSIHIYNPIEYMELDEFTRKNLELTQSLNQNNKKATLLDVLDQTKTSMGARNLRKWIEEPLRSIEKINYRLNIVEDLFNDLFLLNDLQEELGHIYDIERLCGKISYDRVNAKDFLNLKISISKIPNLKNLIENSDANSLKKLIENLDLLEDIHQLIEKSILEEAGMSIKDGNIIKASYNSDVKKLRDLDLNGAKIIKEIEEKEREITGVKSLKISFNKVFGYYIEISKSNLKTFNMPVNYIRKQTLSNAERYITPELKEVEEKILNAQEKIKTLEYEIFNEIKNKIYKQTNRLQSTSKILAQIDSYASLAMIAKKNNYTKPNLNINSNLIIDSGRHPVIENIMGIENFIPNDFKQDDFKEIILLTGPNMAGKSTYMRQVALISLMAHIGSFVPCKKAHIPIFDRIFTRVGASDDLSQGKSTFMVEMSEVSTILKNATKNSLIILDEVGRGTSTYDGLSLAWAIIEYIHNNIGAKTLFATHYHELTELENELDKVANFSVAIQEEGDDIIFLRKIIKGGADRSYGIHVAKLAHLPESLLKRANELLCNLENKSILKNKSALCLNQNIVSKENINNFIDEDKKDIKLKNKKEKQLSLNDLKDKSILDQISKIDLLNITPLQAINILNELQKKARQS